MTRYGQETSVHVRMRELVQQTRAVIIDLLEQDRAIAEDPARSLTASSAGGSIAGAPTDLAAEQKAQIDAISQSWSLLDNLSDMAESQRVRAMEEAAAHPSAAAVASANDTKRNSAANDDNNNDSTTSSGAPLKRRRHKTVASINDDTDTNTSSDASTSTDKDAANRKCYNWYTCAHSNHTYNLT